MTLCSIRNNNKTFSKCNGSETREKGVQIGEGGDEHKPAHAHTKTQTSNQDRQDEWGEGKGCDAAEERGTQ